MITFDQVSTDFRSLVERRRKHLGFLFSTAAAFSILSDGILHGRLPRPLAAEGSDILCVGAASLMLLSFVTALREARLHRGFVYNGTLFQALSVSAGLVIKDGKSRPWTFNPFGVSASLFIVATISGLGLLVFNSAVVGFGVFLAATLSVLCAIALTVYFVQQHRDGVRQAKAILDSGSSPVPDPAGWRDHVTASIDDAHRDMLELLGMSGLVAFFGFQLLAGLGDTAIASLGAVPMATVQLSGPVYLASYMVAITGLTVISYIRLRFAIGIFSRTLNPSDRPFRALSFDDSFYGLIILLGLFGFDLVLLLASAFPQATRRELTVFGIAAVLVVLIGERITMVAVGRRWTRSLKASSTSSST